MTRIEEVLREAIALHREGRLDDAVRLYEAVLSADPKRCEALHMLGVTRLQQGRINEAISLISLALERQPDSADALVDAGFALKVANRFEESIAHYDRALAIRPADMAARLDRAVALAAAGRNDESFADFDQVIAKNQSFDALIGRAKVALALGRVDQAIADFEQALVLAPESDEALNGLGEALARGRRHDEAVACFDSVLAHMPKDVRALNNRGLALWALNRHAEAIASYDEAIATGTADPAPYHNKGNAYLALNLCQQAVDDFDKALAIAPESAETHRSRGHALTNLGRLDEAAASYIAAVTHNPGLPYALGYAALARAQVCDWTDYDQTIQRLSQAVRSGLPACDPLTFVCLTEDPADQLRCAESFVSANYPTTESKRWRGPTSTRRRIRVAYLSADFHEHATAYLIAELFELHDRTRFEIHAVSFGPDTTGPTRSRLRAAADRFLDIAKISDADAADLLHDLEVDIAIDLKGHTQFARPGIFARRPAPIQASYLGYPGTTGAGFIDYIIADDFVIPGGDEIHYRESIVRLPDSYQVNDSKRQIAGIAPDRSAHGLPKRGFVFTCFNANYKINPMVFDVWMRLLKRVEGSVLWLLRGNAPAEDNLRREAQLRGVDPSRLVFAPRMPQGEHLARHRAADLFLDTLPCNAHTTASDALWAGLPVLTCAGRTFASRVAGSLLRALNLPDLVTTSLDDYEARAFELATQPELLSGIKHRLQRMRHEAPLFQTDRFRRHIESGYTKMWETYSRGEKPRSFAVEPLTMS